MSPEQAAKVVAVGFQNPGRHAIPIATAVECPGQDDFAQGAFAPPPFYRVIMERLDPCHGMPAHAGFCEQSSQRLARLGHPQVFQGQSHRTMVG